MNLKRCIHPLKVLLFLLSATSFALPSPFDEGHHFCVPPAPPSSGKVSLGRGDVVVRYSCNEGFKLIGTPVAVCVRGKWSSATPLCEPLGGKMKKINEEEAGMEQKDQQIFTISRVDVSEIEPKKKSLGNKKKKKRKRNRKKKKRNRKVKTSVTTGNDKGSLTKEEQLAKMERKRQRKEERRKNRKNRKNKGRKGRKRKGKKRKMNKLKKAKVGRSNITLVSPAPLEIRRRKKITRKRKEGEEDNSILYSSKNKLERNKKRRKLKQKMSSTTARPPRTTPIIATTQSTVVMESITRKATEPFITTLIPFTDFISSTYEISSMAPVSIKKNKDFLQDIINRMKNPQKVASNLIDSLLVTDNNKSSDTDESKDRSLIKNTLSNKLNADYDNNVPVYDEDYDTLPEGYPELTNNDDKKASTRPVKVLPPEIIELDRKLPEGYPAPEERLFDQDEVNAARARFIETEDIDFEALDASCIISEMDSLYLPTPSIPHGHVTTYRQVTNPTKPNNVYVEAIYECEFKHQLEDATSNRLFCENNKWLGILPNCIPYDIGEGNCGSDNGGCEQICEKRDEDFVCACYRGFTLHRDKTSCIDVDECAKDNGGCEGACFNKLGSHQCFCSPGYRLTTNGKTCIDKNECILRNGHGPCQDTCHNTDGGYYCTCNGIPGTKLANDKHNCEDVDECAINNGGCSHVCLNTFGQIFCSCPIGFTLGMDWKTCNDVNECDFLELADNCKHGCINVPGSYKCADLQEFNSKLDLECSEGMKLSQDGLACEDINECEQDNFSCSHTCVNTHGSAHCECQDGYVIGSDGKECQDINECITLKSSPCSHMCINTEGSFRCSCSIGMFLGPDLRSCVDINECAQNNGDCEHQCLNEIGSFQCDCNNGFLLQDDEQTCLDIDECQIDNGKCDQICTNTEGGYKCECHLGYELEDEFHCIDIDECFYIDQQKCSHKCINSKGSYFCSCHEGYNLHPDNLTCVDIDECGEETPCSHFCTNHEGSFLCKCPAGWFLSEDEITCQDIDECSQDNAGCSHICENTDGGYICSCPEGLSLINDGSTFERKHICIDIDECKIDNGHCSHMCENIEGSFKCSCPAGFQEQHFANDTINCSDVNECLVNNGDCSHTCVNLQGSFECQCPHGYELNNSRKTCMDINECLIDNGGCSHECVNHLGSHRCECPNGWDIDYDYDYDNEATYLEGFEDLLKTCVDINECERPSNNCSHECINEAGSFYCKCPPGHILLNEYKCEDIDECGIDKGGCSHSCINLEGSFECRCPKGFLLVDSTRCFDIDECESNNGNCSQFCINELGKHRCSCSPGFLLEQDNVTCSDVNECGDFNGGCSHQCHNMEGQYTCSCPKGFVLGSDEHMCHDVDECSSDLHLECSHSCVNALGTFSCECPAGLSIAVDERTCVDVDECGLNNGGCSHQCSNEEGDYVCLCPTGMALEEDLHTCIDVNECLNSNGGCSNECLNTEGGFICSCPQGLELGKDNASCIDLDECKVKNGGCQGQCHNTRGSFRCECSKGYHIGSDGFSCQDINECDIANGGCSHDCINAEGSFNCQCPTGYILHERDLKCIDIDECKDHPCEHECHNTLGSFFCECKTGFQPQPDTIHRCWDINECEIDNGGCNQLCYNAIGSFSCACREGYELTEDGSSCRQKPVYCPILVAPLWGFMKCTKDLQGQTYPMDTVCSFSCSEGGMLHGEVNTTCTSKGTWTNEVVSCQAVKCPALDEVENGRVSPGRCLKGISMVGQYCYLTCSHGYRVVGNPVRTCTISGSWSPYATKPYCEKDTLRPFIKCPDDMIVDLLPHQNKAHIRIPKPKSNVDWFRVPVGGNSSSDELLDPENKERFVEASPGWAKNLEDDLPAGRTTISFVARSPLADVKSSCSFIINVKDSEPPQVFGCPNSFKVQLNPSETSTKVSWVEPIFKDNVEVSHIYKSMESGRYLQVGTHPVHYVAVDSQRNRAKCSFVITVEAPVPKMGPSFNGLNNGLCGPDPGPLMGGMWVCNDWAWGRICRPECGSSHVLLNPTSSMLFMCVASSGRWNPDATRTNSRPSCTKTVPIEPGMGCMPGFERRETHPDVCLCMPKKILIHYVIIFSFTSQLQSRTKKVEWLVPRGCSVTSPSNNAHPAQWDSTLTHSEAPSVSSVVGGEPPQRSGHTRGVSVYDAVAISQGYSSQGKSAAGSQSLGLSSSTAFATNKFEDSNSDNSERGGHPTKTRHHHNLDSFYGSRGSPFSHLLQGSQNIALAHASAGSGSSSRGPSGSAFAHAQSDNENTKAIAHARARVFNYG